MSQSVLPAVAGDQCDLTAEASLCAVFQRTAARAPDRVALRTPGGTTTITWRGYAERVESIARGLATLGVGQGDAVAVMLTNRPEFHLVDTAALHLGALTVSVYNTLPVEDVAWVLRDAGAAVMVTEDALLPSARSACAIAGVPDVITVDAGGDGARSLSEVEARADQDLAFEDGWRAIAQDDLAVLIYTSGTTGPPKGVELTHGSLLGNQQGLHAAIGSLEGADVISFLPMAHIAERHLSHYRAMAFGFTVTCCPDMRSVPEALLEVRPQYFFSPPRLFEKFRAGLLASIEAEQDPDGRARAGRLLEAGREKVDLEQAGRPVPEALAEETARLQADAGRVLLARIGLDQVRIALTGSAPVPYDLVEFFVSLGLPLLEAWGISECGAFGAFNRPDDRKIGTVGKPLPGVEVRLEPDGEILMRSPWMMRGYRNRPDQTTEVIDAEGWLHTGDVGSWDDQGNLSIIDRKKELIINAAGKNMSPANIEAKLKEAHPLIGQACVVGDRRPFNVALLVLDSEAAAVHARQAGREGATLAELANDPTVRAAVEQGVEAANQRMSRVEQIKRHLLLADEWLPGGEELTPTMKLRRKPIAKKYAEQIERLYADTQR